MASPQASNGASASQDDHSSLAPSLGATTFHRFPDLPAELQLDIWDHAYPALDISPSVLCFNLKVLRSPEGSVVCFTPDAHVASSTLNHRALLGTCHETRKKALTRLNILTLLRHDPSTGSSTEFRIPFDFERTCFCIGGWEGHGIDDERPGKLIGMDFAKKVKRLAFVVPDARMPPVPSWGEGEDIECLALILFHNAAHIGWIERSASDISKVPTQEVLSSRLSLQPFAQKTMVKGFPMTKVRGERRTLFYRAMRASCN